VPSPEYIGNGVCDNKYNTTECRSHPHASV
jgi:hypothetical protein